MCSICMRIKKSTLKYFDNCVRGGGFCRRKSGRAGEIVYLRDVTKRTRSLLNFRLTMYYLPIPRAMLRFA